MTDLVAAAGGVIHRQVDGDQEILLIHRPRYDDWSFPKGKLDPGESFEQAAVREVFEEADMVVVIGDELPGTTYTDHRGRSKLVRYWAMTVAVELPFRADDEVDERRWVRRSEADLLLSYQRDRDVLGALSESS